MAFTVYLLPAYPPTICSAQPSAVSPPYMYSVHSGHKVLTVHIYYIEHHSVRAPRIREHTGSVIGGRVPATQGSSGPCVYCRKPGVRSLYTYVAS
jgi:hypothetical protein